MKKNKGFTLVELMIVFAIIGIIISVAIPAFKDHEKAELQKQEDVKHDRNVHSAWDD